MAIPSNLVRPSTPHAWGLKGGGVGGGEDGLIHPTRVVQMCGAMNVARAIEWCVWVAGIVEIARGMKRQIHPTRVVQMCGAMNGACGSV